MGVQIDEAWSYPGAFALDERRAFKSGPHLDDGAVGDADIAFDDAILCHDAPA